MLIANQEIINTDENLQIVLSQFFTNELIFVYIWSNLNIYWPISIRDSMPMNTNKELFSYIPLFVIFGHLFDEQ